MIRIPDRDSNLIEVYMSVCEKKIGSQMILTKRSQGYLPTTVELSREKPTSGSYCQSCSAHADVLVGGARSPVGGRALPTNVGRHQSVGRLNSGSRHRDLDWALPG
jgi:hypothetical protein